VSSFTSPLIIMAVPNTQRGLSRLLPPGLQRPRWELVEGFRYAVGGLQTPEQVIEVPHGFRFDGASVPLPFRAFVPMAHPDYIQAAALHDWMLESGNHSRAECDLVFWEALGVLGMPLVWRRIMFAAVRIGAARWHLNRIMRRLFDAH